MHLHCVISTIIGCISIAVDTIESVNYCKNVTVRSISKLNTYKNRLTSKCSIYSLLTSAGKIKESIVETFH